MTWYLQLVIISPEIILILQNMLIYLLFIDCRESHLRTFCRQIHQCAKIREWGVLKLIWTMLGFRKSLFTKVPSLTEFQIWGFTDEDINWRQYQLMEPFGASDVKPVAKITIDVIPPGGQICKKMQVATPGGQICKQCKWRKLVTKFTNEYKWHHMASKFTNNLSGLLVVKFAINQSSAKFSQFWPRMRDLEILQ